MDIVVFPAVAELMKCFIGVKMVLVIVDAQSKVDV